MFVASPLGRCTSMLLMNIHNDVFDICTVQAAAQPGMRYSVVTELMLRLLVCPGPAPLAGSVCLLNVYPAILAVPMCAGMPMVS